MATELAEGNGAAAEGQPNAGALVAVATPNVPVHEGTRNPQVTRPGRARFAIFMDRDTKEPCNWDHKKKQDDAWLLRLARNRGHVREPSAALLIEFEADPLARAAWRQSKWAALSDNAKKPNWRQVVEFWAWVECYAQQYHPGSKFNLMLQQWKLGAGEFNEPLASHFERCLGRGPPPPLAVATSGSADEYVRRSLFSLLPRSDRRRSD